ncbi:putative transposase, Ptta/En/Spm, plant, partial [Sesbania bispinosa]
MQQDHDEFERDADGKYITRPFGKGLSPASVATDAIGTAIRQHFRGPYPSWSETPGDVKDYWFKLFAEVVSWHPSHTPQIKKAFQQRGAKRLSDMLRKARMKAKKPSWMGNDAWTGLLTYWDQNPDFKKMLEKIGRNLDSDELFLETHRKKSGEWVDDRSRMTYTEYQSRMQDVQSQVDEVSPSGPQQVDGATKLGLWVEVAGGKSRGRCYGTADMSSHIQR